MPRATLAAGGRLKATYLFANGSASFAEKVSYSYNPLGQVELVTRTKGATTETWTYGYDADGRQTRVTSAERTVNHVYDPATGRHTATWTGTNVNPPGTRTEYTHDALGRLETVSPSARDGVAIIPEVTTYRYDAAGNLTDVLQSNGVLSDYIYDALYRLTTLIHFVDADGDYTLDVGESLKAKFAYTWNPDNTKATETATDDLGRQTHRSGMQYLRAGYYDPHSGRFVKLDSFRGAVASLSDLNHHAYAGANPVSAIDPTRRIQLI